ncbi:vitamin B12 ABC transporter permease BtuC [Martelella alba]|uniref:Vitamin B12 ABC transporter permease BtuC n=1 Tax=Martelella alba TaxID=2590451 RepID=A0ABY2SP89_9HYPH|nr:vitamin B12 ABC transporter permease BtuC [Martelella alba]TKI05620.1 vitamin B12 ABC transporter permease BtuC [Martelella alba]
MSASNPLLSELQRRQWQRDRTRMAWLCLFLLLAFIISLCAGDTWFWPTRWFSQAADIFVWQLRLPRALAVMAVGAALAQAGAAMQNIFENPLAEPGLLGISNGAGVALTLAVVVGGDGLPIWGLGLCAVGGALVVTAILLVFARRNTSNARLLLVGVALGILCSAIMTWAVYFSTSLDLRQLIYWMMGGFGGVDWRDDWLMISLAPAIVWLSLQGRSMNLLALGELPARQLGVSVFIRRNLFVLVFGWLVGISVALAGVIGFIGLVVPHILRLTGLTDHRRLLPGSALAGAGVLLLADAIARTTLNAAELPIGVVTATLGSPIFIWLLIKIKG